MKLRNIFLLISCCFAAFSCSMEDDTIMNDVESTINNIDDAATEMYTAINLNIKSIDLMSKSTTIKDGETEEPNYDAEHESKNEKYISSFDIFVLEEGKIIHIISQTGQVVGENTSDITLKDTRFLTKYKEGRKLTAYAIINAQSAGSENIFSNVKIGDREEVFLNKEIANHLKANELVKVGSLDIVMNDESFYHTSSVKNFPENKDFRAEIPVSHIAARIDFDKFSYTLNGFGDRAPKIELVEARFENIQSKGWLNGNEFASFVKGEDVNLTKIMTVDKECLPALTAYSYCNQSYEQPVQLYIKVRVTEDQHVKEYEKTYVVNPAQSGKSVDHNYVKGGYLYNLTVNWTISPKWADSTIEFYTKDWEYHSLGEVEL